ncbi:MAG: hypothetical protein ACLTTJ_14205 [Blautia sp.]
MMCRLHALTVITAADRSRYVTEDTLENYRIVDSSFKILKRFATGSRQITVEYWETKGKTVIRLWLQKTLS